eukprot:TRINITY_DN29973_c5_g1_i1.p1 TRINITY_DN29973_c5_g1~~TRINITY_DN29973_c5_g1_i1.p1  ORF type:complete len:1017 (+),score=274.49 TRINITY_DN29973_c5_g1_i1:40-3090(+)
MARATLIASPGGATQAPSKHVGRRLVVTLDDSAPEAEVAWLRTRALQLVGVYEEHGQKNGRAFYMRGEVQGLYWEADIAYRAWWIGDGPAGTGNTAYAELEDGVPEDTVPDRPWWTTNWGLGYTLETCQGVSRLPIKIAAISGSSSPEQEGGLQTGLQAKLLSLGTNGRSKPPQPEPHLERCRRFQHLFGGFVRSSLQDIGKQHLRNSQLLKLLTAAVCEALGIHKTDAGDDGQSRMAEFSERCRALEASLAEQAQRHAQIDSLVSSMLASGPGVDELQLAEDEDRWREVLNSLQAQSAEASKLEVELVAVQEAANREYDLMLAKLAGHCQKLEAKALGGDADADSMLTAYADHCDSLKAIARERAERCSALEEELEGTRSRESEAKAQVERLSKDLPDKYQKLEAALGEQARRNAKLEVDMVNMREAKKALSRYTEQCQQLEAMLKEKTNRNGQLEDEMAGLRATLRELQGSADAHMRASTQRCNTLKEAFDAQVLRNQTLQAEFLGIREAAEQGNSQDGSTREKCEKLLASLQEQTSESSQLQAELEAVSTKEEAAKEKLQRSLPLEEQLDKLRREAEETERLRSELQASSERCTLLQSALEEQTRRNARMELTYTEADARGASAQARISELERDLEEHKRRNIELNVELTRVAGVTSPELKARRLLDDAEEQLKKNYEQRSKSQEALAARQANRISELEEQLQNLQQSPQSQQMPFESLLLPIEGQSATQLQERLEEDADVNGARQETDALSDVTERQQTHQTTSEVPDQLTQELLGRAARRLAELRQTKGGRGCDDGRPAVAAGRLHAPISSVPHQSATVPHQSAGASIASSPVGPQVTRFTQLSHTAPGYLTSRSTQANGGLIASPSATDLRPPQGLSPSPSAVPALSPSPSTVPLALASPPAPAGALSLGTSLSTTAGSHTSPPPPRAASPLPVVMGVATPSALRSPGSSTVAATPVALSASSAPAGLLTGRKHAPMPPPVAAGLHRNGMPAALQRTGSGLVLRRPAAAS